MVRTNSPNHSQQSGSADCLSIQLAEDRSYRPQETISGKITLNLKTPSKVKNIVVTLSGTAENSSHRNVGLSSPPFLKMSSEVFNGLDTTINAAENPRSHGKETQILPAGTHQWNFSLVLPSSANLPNTLDSHRNQVVYTLSVLATRPYEQADLMTDTEVRIRDPIFIDQEPHSLPAMFRCPFHLSRKANWLVRSPAGKSLSLLAPLKALAKSGHSTNANRRGPATDMTIADMMAPSTENEDISANLSLARTGYRAGEQLRIMVRVSGAPLSAPIDVKARLRRVCVHRINSLVDVEDVIMASGQRPLDSNTGTFELQLPRQMLSSTQGSGTQLNAMDGQSCMTVRYTLEVTLRYCVGPRLLATRPSARFRIPIVIGTYEQQPEIAQRRWSIWWRMMSLGDDAMRNELVANGLDADEDLVDQMMDDELQSLYAAEALPVYEPPPPSYEASSAMARQGVNQNTEGISSGTLLEQPTSALVPSLNTASSSRSSLSLAEQGDNIYAESFSSPVGIAVEYHTNTIAYTETAPPRTMVIA